MDLSIILGNLKNMCTQIHLNTTMFFCLLWRTQSDHAEEIRKAYWKKEPKTNTTQKGTKRSRPSSSSVTAATPTPTSQRKPKASRVSNVNGSSKGNPVKVDHEEEEEDESLYVQTHVDAMDKYEDVKSWEDLVESVDTIERGNDGELKVYLTM